ncbi:uncharacterized protein M421DRAFT_89056 [Didymella exigua CBS 183.55]|uniref:Uncharacterized protein n=1 Tax=Didymella exigua CBS 183.55 TaxID=1150837 RepID=A0A6A5RW27_9PLEO|nr:uncharacterized protein M421DRAFT_89056 [Didymella exigua CBS 183.55]KAF1932691.1 hypothetical protein M421DRAFT_89056 [Didymella exigua CBS 183.55]
MIPIITMMTMMTMVHCRWRHTWTGQVFLGVGLKQPRAAQMLDFSGDDESGHPWMQRSFGEEGEAVWRWNLRRCVSRIASVAGWTKGKRLGSRPVEARERRLGSESVFTASDCEQRVQTGESEQGIAPGLGIVSDSEPWRHARDHLQQQHLAPLDNGRPRRWTMAGRAACGITNHCEKGGDAASQIHILQTNPISLLQRLLRRTYSWPKSVVAVSRPGREGTYLSRCGRQRHMAGKVFVGGLLLVGGWVRERVDAIGERRDAAFRGVFRITSLRERGVALVVNSAHAKRVELQGMLCAREVRTRKSRRASQDAQVLCPSPAHPHKRPIRS